MRVASKVGHLPSELDVLGLWVLELFAMYATDGRTKATLIAPFPYGRGNNKLTLNSLERL